MEIMLSKKPNVNYKDAFDRTPLHHACNSGNTTAALMLLSVEGIEVNAVTISGETPLMKAAAFGDMDLCIKLIEAKADASLKDNYGMTAEKYAKCYRKDSNVHELLKSFTQEDDVEMAD